MAWAKNGTPDTLSGTSDTIEITDLTSKLFNQTITHLIASGAISQSLRLGSTSLDSGTNYADRLSDNGGSDVTGTTQSSIRAGGNITDIDSFIVYYFINIAAEEKLVIGHCVDESASGATTAPFRREFVGKWTNTSNQTDVLGFVNGQSGDYAANSNLSALGTD